MDHLNQCYCTLCRKPIPDAESRRYQGLCQSCAQAKREAGREPITPGHAKHVHEDPKALDTASGEAIVRLFESLLKVISRLFSPGNQPALPQPGGLGICSACGSRSIRSLTHDPGAAVGCARVALQAFLAINALVALVCLATINPFMLGLAIPVGLIGLVMLAILPRGTQHRVCSDCGHQWPI
jgi:hypothetical protein